jgi:signal transduction histidine kinase
MSDIENVLDGLADAFMIFDHDWRFRHLNRSAAEWFLAMMGIDASTVQDRVLWEVAPQLVGTRFESEYRAALRDGRPRAFEAFHEQRQAWYDVRVFPTAETVTLQIRDVTRDKQRQQFLSEASRVLSETLDYTETLRRLARLAVPRVADWCAIDIATGEGTLERVEVVHSDPDRVALAHELRRRFPAAANENIGVMGVFRNGRSVHVRELTPEMLETGITDRAYFDMIRSLGLRSLMIVPLTAHGKTLGVMTFISAESGRLYDQDDVAFAEDLAHRAAVAADNAHLFEAAQRRAREEAALRKAAEAVTAQFSVDDVIQQIALSALDATEADGSFVERLQPDGKSIVVVAAAGTMHPELGARTPYEGSLAHMVLEARAPQIVFATATQQAPGVLAHTFASSNALVVPLMDAGEAIGTLILVRAAERVPFTQDEAQRAHTFGNLAALAFRKVHLLQDSERKREELEAVIESRGRLMRGFSHDLKNPIGAADGHAALLEDGMLGELTSQQKQHVGRIREAIRNAVSLINDLVELARAESGQLQIRQQPLDVREIARELVEQYRPAAEQAGLTISGVLEKVVVIPGDADRVRQVLGNLISNAVKYTPRGGAVEVKTAIRKSDNGLDERACVVVDVADTGIGIPEDKLDVLFKEFERIDPMVRPGAGLGLAISRRIARLLGGDVTCRTQRGSGSTFTLWLPDPG